MITLNVEIPEDMDTQIRQICEERGCSVDEAIRDVLRRWIARQRFNALAQDTEKHARAAGFSSEDDILGAVS